MKKEKMKKELQKIHNEYLNGDEVTDNDIIFFKKCLDNNLLKEQAISDYLWSDRKEEE